MKKVIGILRQNLLNLFRWCKKMGICRDINILVPELREKAVKFLSICKEKKIEVSIIETFRSNLIQSAYYAQGRKNLEEVNLMRKGAGLSPISQKENVKITNTQAGYSKHNIGKAFDVCPILNGKLAWNDIDLFSQLGEIGLSVGLKWGGDWRSFKDSPHFEI